MTDGQQIAASEPKPYWRSLRPGETVYILNDVVDVPEVPQDVSLLMKEQGMKIVSETAERIAREQALKMVEKIISRNGRKNSQGPGAGDCRKGHTRRNREAQTGKQLKKVRTVRKHSSSEYRPGGVNDSQAPVHRCIFRSDNDDDGLLVPREARIDPRIRREGHPDHCRDAGESADS